MPPVVKKLIPVRKATPTRISSAGSVLDRIAPIGMDGAGIKMMIYGESGHGKTTFWGTFPGRTLALICSGSEQPGEVRSIDTAANRKRIKQVVVTSTEEFVELVEALKDGPLTNQYDNVVLDHVSALSDRAMMEIKRWTEMPIQKSFGMARREDYGELATRMKTLLRAYLGVPQNAVVIAQQRSFGGRSDEDEGGTDEPTPTRIGAALTPSVAGWLNTVVDYIAQAFKRPKVVIHKSKVGKEVIETERVTDEPEYCLRVGSSGLYHTKFRIPGGVKANVVVDPTYDKIMSLIRGEFPVG